MNPLVTPLSMALSAPLTSVNFPCAYRLTQNTIRDRFQPYSCTSVLNIEGIVIFIFIVLRIGGSKACHIWVSTQLIPSLAVVKFLTKPHLDPLRRIDPFRGSSPMEFCGESS